MHVLLAGYMWLFIHRPFEIWPRLGEMRIERVYMLATLCCWLLTSNKGWTSNRLNLAFVVFFIVLFIAWIASPYREAGTLTVENIAKSAVFYVLVMSCVRDERTLRFLLIAFLVCNALYMAHSLREYFNGRHVYRMGTARMIGVDTTLSDPNSFAASLIYALPITIPLWRCVGGYRDRALLLGYTAMTAMCILLTGSRSGLVGLAVLTVMLVGLSRHRWRIAIAVLILAPLVWLALPVDRQNRYMTLIDPSRGPANAQRSAESRGEFFVQAVELWKRSPVWGYGPGGFRIASETGMQPHSLYAQLLAETGVLGIAAFTGILASFALNVRDTALCYGGMSWNERGFPYWVATSIGVAVVCLLVMGMAGHNLFRYTWLWYGAFQAVALSCARHDATRSLLELEESWANYGRQEQVPLAR